MDFLKHMSLKKSLFVLTSLHIGIATLLSVVAFCVCVEIRSLQGTEEVRINSFTTESGSAVLEGQEEQIENEQGFEIAVSEDMGETTGKTKAITGIVEVLQYLLPVLFYIASSVLTAVQYYRLKLKEPVALLAEGAKCIMENDLDFTISLDTEDELGQLCRAFEVMRQTLAENFRELWQQTEERKRLNAAFSHELRNPLTVLKGAVKLARRTEAANEETQRKEQLSEQLSLIETYTGRLEAYVEVMSHIQRLEQLPLAKEKVRFEDVVEGLRQTYQHMLAGREIQPDFTSRGAEGDICLDKTVLMQIMENLLSNALTYARESVKVTCERSGESLRLTVCDDGGGFPESYLQKEIAPFQKCRQQEEENGQQVHFGMGLYLCGLLCKKHGGELQIGNTQKGASVCVTIKVNTCSRQSSSQKCRSS